MKRARSFAIVPAAGASRRMGTAKLLLPWNETTVIEQVLGVWRQSHVTRTTVVIRGEDVELVARVAGEETDVVVPSVDPPEMKVSVQHALRHIEEHYRPEPDEAWLLAPADLPRLTAEAIDAVLRAYVPGSGRAVVPSAGGRRGHPILLPWSMASAVFALGEGEGVDRLLGRVEVDDVPMADPSPFDDIDRPDDYRRLRGE